MSTNEFSIAASMENLPDMVDFVKSSLEKCRLDKKQVMKTVLLAEDMLAELIQHRAADDSVAFNASAAALPSAMKSCRDKLGISHKI